MVQGGGEVRHNLAAPPEPYAYSCGSYGSLCDLWYRVRVYHEADHIMDTFPTLGKIGTEPTLFDAGGTVTPIPFAGSPESENEEASWPRHPLPSL